MFKKTIIIFLYSLIFILITVAYLTYFGIETKRFNQAIKEKVSENNNKIKVELNKVKIVLNPVNFNSINTTTQFRVRVREDWGCDPSLWSPIITVPINNVLTPPISHN